MDFSDTTNKYGTPYGDTHQHEVRIGEEQRIDIIFSNRRIGKAPPSLYFQR